MSLVEKVKSLCESKGETIASLERKMKLGNGTIRKWDNATPSGDKLAKIADYFHVSVDYLLGREVNIPTQNDAPDENYTILTENAKKLSAEERKQLLDVARIFFKDAFGE